MHDPQDYGSGRRVEYVRPKPVVWPWIVGSIVLGFGILIGSAVVVRYAQEEMEDQNEILERKMRERDAQNGIIAPKPKKPTIRPRATPTGGAKKADGGGYEFVGMIPGPKPGTNRPTTRSLDPNAIEPPAIPPRPRPEPIVRRYESVKVEPAASATPSGTGKTASATTAKSSAADTKVNLNVNAPLQKRPDPTPAEAAMLASIEDVLKAGKPKDSRSYGHGHKNYRDVPESGALLIGLDISESKDGPWDIITAVRPLFWSRTGTKVGEWHGEPVNKPKRIEARPGYAVGNILQHSGISIDGIQIIFMRLVDGTLDPEDSYESLKHGSFPADGGSTELMFDAPSLVVGIQGREPFRPGMHAGFGLVSVPAMPYFGKPLETADEDKFFRRIAEAVNNDETQDSEVIGMSETAMRELPPSPGILVGLEVTVGPWENYTTIRSLRPIFRTRTGIVEGEWSGNTKGRIYRLEAKPGYAIGSLKLRHGWAIDTIVAVYMRITTHGLDPNDSYESESVGAEPKGRERILGDGSLIVGIHGAGPTDLNKDGCGLGFVTLKKK